MPIKHILFDLGNVVFTNDDWFNVSKEMRLRFSEIYDISYEDMLSAKDASWYNHQNGKLNEDEFWQAFFRKTGAKNHDSTKAKEIYRSSQNEIEDMPNLLRKLKMKYMIGALTNIAKDWLTYKLKKYEMESVFDVIIASSDVKAAKPEDKIYEVALKKIQCRPDECIFIDDREKNLETARKFGFICIQFMNQADIEAKLQDYGVVL